ncbi:hypothetical protein [Microbacterium tumbae]
MEKIICTYRLRPDVTLEQYSAYSKEIDQRITNGETPVIRFEVYAVEETVDGEYFCDIVEDIEVTDFAAWQEALAGENMSYPVKVLFERYIVPESLVTLRTSRIRPAVASGERPPLPADAPEARPGRP